MKPVTSNIVERSTGRQAFLYHARPADRTLVNLYFRHTKPYSAAKQVTSIRRAAFEISIRIPKFTAEARNYTRPSTYY